MSATIAIATSAALNAQVAAQSARESARCTNVLNTYQPNLADVAAKRDYAACVYHIYGSGQAFSAGDLIWMKVALISAIVGLLVGVYAGWRSRYAVTTYFWDMVILGIAGACIFPLLVCLAWLFTMAFSFLFLN